MKIYNTLTREKEELVPIRKGKIGMYVCGITAYDSCHIGHARAAVAFDIIVRYLRHKGLKVKTVRNYTDIDDKIINRAAKENRDWKELAEFYILEYAKDMASLGNLKPDIEPRATDHIKEMISTIKKLVEKGLAYQTKSGVYFSVRKFKDYGKLSGKNIEDLESGARVEVDEEKQDPLDFALWKASKPGEPKWPSPWGEGRPGWHIECSAMSSKYLGQPFDIHGGGRDLIFPHHENEIAQAEGAEGEQFVKYWLHNGFVNINSEKMSKSLGNFLTIGEILKHHDFEAVRFFLLSSQYRSPIDYTEQNIAEAAQAVDRFYEMRAQLSALKDSKLQGTSKNVIPTKVGIHETSKTLDSGFRRNDKCEVFRDAQKKIDENLTKAFDSLDEKISAFMDDDFNTAGAIGAVFELVRLTNKHMADSGTSKWLAKRWEAASKLLHEIFGIFGSEPAEYQARRKKQALSAKGADARIIETLIEERKAARQAKDFAKADAVKKRLAEMGVELRDKPDGTTGWSIK